MVTLHRLLLGCLVGSLAACGAAPNDDAAEGAPDHGAPVSGDSARGRALADAHSCATCHQADYGGAGFYPNVTPDPQSGIGRWSDAQIGRALLSGQDDAGDSLCSIMQRFAFSEQQTADVIAYLRSLPAVSRPNQSECPGHGAAAR
jgi:mono/diheme cytochrome c family protein